MKTATSSRTGSTYDCGTRARERRIDLIDAARGFMSCSWSSITCSSIWWNFLERRNGCFQISFSISCTTFAGLFIFLSGLSSQFSRSNVKRGLKAFAIAIVFTIVTSLPFINMPIRFGVLHLLGFCMVFYGLTRKAWDGIPRAAAPVIYIALLVGSALAARLIFIDVPYLYMFGWLHRLFSAITFRSFRGCSCSCWGRGRASTSGA